MLPKIYLKLVLVKVFKAIIPYNIIMPKTKINYENAIIYKIVCNDLNIKDLYVGHTTDFIRRKYDHKKRCCHFIIDLVLVKYYHHSMHLSVLNGNSLSLLLIQYTLDCIHLYVWKCFSGRHSSSYKTGKCQHSSSAVFKFLRFHRSFHSIRFSIVESKRIETEFTRFAT